MCGSVKPSPAALIRAALNGFSSCLQNDKRHPFRVPFIIGAGNRTRTCMLSRWNLRVMSP